MSDPDSEAGDGLIVLTADADAVGARLDQWLAARLAPSFSRSRIQSLIRSGAVRLTKGPVLEPKRKLTGGERIVVALPEIEAPEPKAEAIPLAILYEDDELIVIDKPPGLVVHPGAGNHSGTLVNALIHHCGSSLSGIGGVGRPGIVHRLDKDTSGVLVAAKTDRTHRALSSAFADHGKSGNLDRAYLALIWGAPSQTKGMIDAPLGRGTDRTLRSVVPRGRADARRAVTHYTVLERFHRGPGESAVASLAECRLETGRTHQIRVHLAHLGHPVIGDPDYGRRLLTKASRLDEPLRSQVRSFRRQALHARLLAFLHPVTGQKMQFVSPMPADMEALVNAFRRIGKT